PTPPAVASSTPPPGVAGHGPGPGPPAPGAVPPIPVAAPPLGALGLPAASVRLPIFSGDPEAASSTTIVCTEPAASRTAWAARPPAAVNLTTGVPALTAWYEVAWPNASCRARVSAPTATVTRDCFTDAWMTRTSTCEPACPDIWSVRTCSRRAEAGPMLATV